MKKFYRKIPNIITTFRLLLVPLFLIIFFLPALGSDGPIWALLVFGVAGLSDLLDGFLARKLNAITDYGKLIDPLADKLISLGAIVCLTLIQYIPWTAFFIIAAKEILMVIGGLVLYNRKVTVYSNVFGKLTAFLTNVALILCFVHAYILEWTGHTYDWYVLYVALGMQIVALIQYAYINVFIPYREGRFKSSKH